MQFKHKIIYFYKKTLTFESIK